jgi:hypothetical protein
MRGEQLALKRTHEAFTINGKNVTTSTDFLMVANGSSMFPVAKLLLPDAK